MTYITKLDNTSLNDFVNETRSNDITTFWDDKLEENSNSGRYAYKCCANCPNNPLNNPNASGICHCILPTLENVRY